MAWCVFIAFACLVAAGWIRLFFIVRAKLRKRGAQSGRLRRLTWRLRWRQLRRVRVPRDGEPLNEKERAAELLAMRGWADHAGTAALKWPELQIEAELREGAE